MSGKKQHYIPQFLLRNFAQRRGTKPYRVFVYSTEFGVFNTATSNIGAERHFYSDPSKDGIKTLDDEITSFENRVAKSLEMIASSPKDNELNSNLVAEAITHLCVRQASLRHIVSQTFGKIADAVTTTFSDESKAWKAFGLDKGQATGQIRESFEELYEKHRSAMQAKGFLTKEAFVEFAFTWTKGNFSQNFATQKPQIDNLLRGINKLASTMPREAHVKALRQGLAPAPRVEELIQLRWRLLPLEPNQLILPDCIAIGLRSDGSSEPLLFSKEPVLVIMPLRHNLAVVGGGPSPITLTPDAINAALAGSSWNFFVSREQTIFFKQLLPTVGISSRSKLNGMFDDIIRDLGW